MQLDLNKLATDAREGSRPAAIELIEGLYARVYAFLRRLAGNDADAADLTQRTFGRVWDGLGGFAGRSSVSSWVHGIAYHVYVDWRRANHRFESRSDDWWAACPSPEPGPDETVARWDSAAAVYGQVETLEAPLRESVHLHYYQGLSLEETAEVLGVATSTVKYRVRQAVDQLQKRLSPPVRMGG